jgi:hypothetical protein
VSAGIAVATVGGEMSNRYRQNLDAFTPSGRPAVHEGHEPATTPTDIRDTLDTLAIGLAADDGGVRRLFDRVAAHTASEALHEVLAEVGALALLRGSEAYLAAVIDGWHRDRGGRAC